MAGKISEVHQILLLLYQHLKYFTEGDVVPSFLSNDLGHSLTSLMAFLNSGVASLSNGWNSDHGSLESVLSAEASRDFVERLQQTNLLQLPSSEHKTLIQSIQTILAAERYRRSVDANGFRYICASELHRTSASTDVADWRDIVFASHSISQDILVDLVTSKAEGKLTWEIARTSGMFLWLSDTEAVHTQMENVARTEYTKHEDRNPVNCSLYYLALQKKQVLQGLWRMSVGIREKENTTKLLAHNFSEPRWRATALKNAYALISKRRFEYAAAFFLLGGSLKDAVNVCVYQMKQLDLGISIARVYEGDGGPVLRELLVKTVLPQAASTGNRWMASWAFHKLGKQNEALQAFVRPLPALIAGANLDLDRPIVGTKQAQSWYNNEPCQAYIYNDLRAKLVKDRKWIKVVEPREEWNFVLRCARHYTKMGCDLLALELVRSWEFVKPSQELSTIERPTNLIPVIPTTEEGSNRQETLKKKVPPPTQFQEPSSSSLLDSFGF